MRLFSKLALANAILAASLTLAACGADEGGGMSGMESMDETNGASSAPETTKQDDEESTMETGGMDQSMDHGSMEMGDMGAMLEEGGEYSDERFIDLMVPHHQGAVEMARIALDGNAEREEITTLSRDIIETQNAEIEELEDIKEREFGTREVSESVSGEDMAMMRMMDDPGAFADSEPFDLAFIEQMIPHHESAIEMSEVALENSRNDEIRALADEIITAQRSEIEEMQTWREKWYPES